MGSSSQTTGYWYLMMLHFGWALGELDELVEIRGGDRTAWKGHRWTPTSYDHKRRLQRYARGADAPCLGNERIVINEPNLWGGEKQEGGIVGEFDVMMGGPTQMPNDYLATVMGPQQSGNRGKAGGVFRGGRVGANNPYPKPWAFRVRRALKGWDGSVWYPGKCVIPLAGGQIKAMNPAHILYETLTNRQWGQGEPRALINEASFTAAADTLFTEGFGLCDAFESGERIEDFQQRIIDTIGASLSQSRQNGQYYLDLIRDGYDINTLPVITEDDVLSVEHEPSLPSESVNQILVEWFDPITRQDRTTTPVQSLGSIQAVGAVVSETHTYRNVPTEDLALRIAGRDLGAKSTPLTRFKLLLNRRRYDLRPGLPVRLQLPSSGFADVVIRTGIIKSGTPTKGEMHLTATQDIYAMPSTVYAKPSPGFYVPSDPTPQPPPHQRAFEAAYVDLAGRLSAADLEALAVESGYLSTLAARPSGLALNYRLYTRAVGESFEERTLADWVPTATVIEAADRVATSVTLSGGQDLDAVGPGDAALWGNELCRVVSLNTGSNALVLARGCGDTVPQLHAAGERIWFYGREAGTDGREYLDGETVEAKLLTRTVSAQLDPASATTLSVAMARRAARPYPPGRLRFTDSQVTQVAYPASLTGPIVVSWAHRDRLVQADQLVDTNATSIAAEVGTSYSVSYEQPPGTVVHAVTGLTGTSAQQFAFPASGEAAVSVTSHRDGLSSRQALFHQFGYTSQGGGGGNFYWSSTDKSASVQLSQGNATAGRASTGTWVDSGVRSVTAHSSGKRYAEFRIDGTRNPSEIMCGVATGAASFGSFIGASSGGWVLQNDTSGPSTLRLAGSAIASGLAAQGAGGRVMVAYDADTGRIWLGAGGAWYNSGDPASGTNPTATIAPATQLYLGLSLFASQNIVTLRNNAGEAAYPIPSGFVMWG